MSEQRKTRVGQVNTIAGCKGEMSRVYRKAAKGDLDSLVAARLVTILQAIVATTRDTEIELRVHQLEEIYERKQQTL